MVQAGKKHQAFRMSMLQIAFSKADRFKHLQTTQMLYSSVWKVSHIAFPWYLHLIHEMKAEVGWCPWVPGPVGFFYLGRLTFSCLLCYLLLWWLCLVSAFTELQDYLYICYLVFWSYVQHLANICHFIFFSWLS